MILSKVFTMNKTKKNNYLLILLGLSFSIVSQNSFSKKLEDSRVHDGHGHGHSHSHDSLFEGKPVSKPSSSILLDYELPKIITVGQESSLTVLLDSALQAPGSFSVYYKADEGLDVTSQDSLSIDFSGKPVSTVVTFSSQVDGLYYLNFGVMQLDENSRPVQARSFVIPIQVGANEYVGKVSNTQSRVSSKVRIDTETSSSRRIIEMIAE